MLRTYGPVDLWNSQIYKLITAWIETIFFFFFAWDLWTCWPMKLPNLQIDNCINLNSFLFLTLLGTCGPVDLWNFQISKLTTVLIKTFFLFLVAQDLWTCWPIKLGILQIDNFMNRNSFLFLTLLGTCGLVDLWNFQISKLTTVWIKKNLSCFGSMDLLTYETRKSPNWELHEYNIFSFLRCLRPVDLLTYETLKSPKFDICLNRICFFFLVALDPWICWPIICGERALSWRGGVS